MGLHYAIALCHHQLLSPFVCIILTKMEFFLIIAKCFYYFSWLWPDLKAYLVFFRKSSIKP